eukprot:1885053-Lingulodinium_polyedra.AAC.1
MSRLRRIHARPRLSPCVLADPNKCPSAPGPMSVCVCVRLCPTKRKWAFRLDDMTGCVYANARL